MGPAPAAQLSRDRAEAGSRDSSRPWPAVLEFLSFVYSLIRGLGGLDKPWEEPSARKTHARIRERKSRMAGVNAGAKLHHWAGVKVHQ